MTRQAAVWCAIVGAVIGGCKKTETGSAESGTAASAKVLHLAFVTNNASDFWTIARVGTKKAEQETPNIKVDFQIPSDGTAAGQKRVVDDLLTRGVDGMAISPVDPANETSLLNNVAGQALLFTQDSDAPGSKRLCYIGTDNHAAGLQAGELIKKTLPGGGKIMLFVGKRDAQNARDRFNGIQQALEGSKIQILGLRTDDADHVRAKANALDTLVAYPDIAGLVGLWSYNGPAILSAVRESKKAGQVRIVCFDEEDASLDGVRSGDVYATIVQQPYEFGRKSMELMARVLRGDKSAIPADKQLFVPTLAIQKDNVDEFQSELNKLRGRK